MTMKTKQRMLTEDWELFKQRRFIEEQVRLGDVGGLCACAGEKHHSKATLWVCS